MKMKKSNVILLIAVIVISVIVAVVYFSDKDSTELVLRDFAVADTAAIDQIFLADKNGNSVLLEREGDHWIVNGDFIARRDFIEVLLTTLKNIEVKSPVPEAKLDKVTKSLSVKGIKADIYQKGELIKTYYVGGVTADNTGTYMILEGSEQPFVLHIPGFAGYLTVRYLPYINEWRERIVFRYKVAEIKKIRVEYPMNPHESFVAYSYGNNEYGITDLSGSSFDFAIDTIKIKEFISKVKFIGLEAYLSEQLNDHKRDSLLEETMSARYTVENRAGEEKDVRIYLRQNINQAVDDDGKPYDWDIDNLYGIINDDKEVVLLQHYVIDPISLTSSSFELKN